MPAGLSRRVSALATPEQLAALLVGGLAEVPGEACRRAGPRGGLARGLLGSVPAVAYLVSAKERKVVEQVAGNRYVGIHIALGNGRRVRSCTKISEVFEGGPPIARGSRTTT